MIKELAGAVTRLLILFGACAALAGLLLYSAELVPQKTPTATREAEKIGPASALASAPAAPPASAASARPPVTTPFVPAPPAQEPAALPMTPPDRQTASAAFAPSSLLGDSTTRPEAGTSVLAKPRSPSLPANVVEPLQDDEGTRDVSSAAPARQANNDAARPARSRGERGSQGCTSYRTYNAETQTYRSYDGKIKPCRPNG